MLQLALVCLVARTNCDSFFVVPSTMLVLKMEGIKTGLPLGHYRVDSDTTPTREQLANGD